MKIGNENLTASAMVVHSNFDNTSLKDNIAILQIQKPENVAAPICLTPSLSTMDVLGENTTIGALDREQHETFQELMLEDKITCLENNREEFGKYLSSKMLCLTDFKMPGGKILTGDGLYQQFYDDTKGMYSWKIIGIASFTKNTPYFLFTDVSKYYSFISSNTFVH